MNSGEPTQEAVAGVHRVTPELPSGRRTTTYLHSSHSSPAEERIKHKNKNL